jgi:hypothetical protein
MQAAALVSGCALLVTLATASVDTNVVCINSTPSNRVRMHIHMLQKRNGAVSNPEAAVMPIARISVTQPFVAGHCAWSTG